MFATSRYAYWQTARHDFKTGQLFNFRYLTGMGRIEFQVEDKNGDIRKKAFSGKWIVPMEDEVHPKGWGCYAAAAITAKGQIFIGQFKRNDDSFYDYQVVTTQPPFEEGYC